MTRLRPHRPRRARGGSARRVRRLDTRARAVRPSTDEIGRRVECAKTSSDVRRERRHPCGIARRAVTRGRPDPVAPRDAAAADRLFDALDAALPRQRTGRTGITSTTRPARQSPGPAASPTLPRSGSTVRRRSSSHQRRRSTPGPHRAADRRRAAARGRPTATIVVEQALGAGRRRRRRRAAASCCPRRVRRSHCGDGVGAGHPLSPVRLHRPLPDRRAARDGRGRAGGSRRCTRAVAPRNRRRDCSLSSRSTLLLLGRSRSSNAGACARRPREVRHGDGRHRRCARAVARGVLAGVARLDDTPSAARPLDLLLTALVAAPLGMAGARPDRAPAADGSAGAAADVGPYRRSADVRRLPRGRRARRSRCSGAYCAPAADRRSADQRRPAALFAAPARRAASPSRSASSCSTPPSSGRRPRWPALADVLWRHRGADCAWLATIAWAGGALLAVAADFDVLRSDPCDAARCLRSRPRGLRDLRCRGSGFARGTCRRRCGWARCFSRCSCPSLALYPSLSPSPPRPRSSSSPTSTVHKP